MNEISVKRLELAAQNFNKFKNENVIAGFVTGSVAKGYADDYSDIDTIIIYDKEINCENLITFVSAIASKKTE